MPAHIQWAGMAKPVNIPLIDIQPGHLLIGSIVYIELNTQSVDSTNDIMNRFILNWKCQIDLEQSL